MKTNQSIPSTPLKELSTLAPSDLQQYSLKAKLQSPPSTLSQQVPASYSTTQTNYSIFPLTDEEVYKVIAESVLQFLPKEKLMAMADKLNRILND
jgi:hypothetical protein